jgi:hypothetical protein
MYFNSAPEPDPAATRNRLLSVHILWTAAAACGERRGSEENERALDRRIRRIAIRYSRIANSQQRTTNDEQRVPVFWRHFAAGKHAGDE